jgi:CO/xanthine dehydrogenase FAD-binding subunit
VSVEAFTTAATVDEALAALAAGARPVAGGTDLVVGARQGKAPLPPSLVAIHRIDELRRIEETDRGVRLGSLVSHADLVSHPTILGRLTAIADASAIVGSRATRAHGTIGGNVMNASPAMETGGPLMCFGATATLRSAAGAREVAVEELFVGPGRTQAEPDELLVALDIPLPAAGTGSAYVRLEYRRQIEIAVTALAPTIRRVPEAEAALVGTACGSEPQAKAAAAAAAAASPISDVRASERYRRAMAEVIASRAIGAALARARGDDVPVPASPALHGGLS